MLVAVDVEDLDGFVGGTGCESAAVVVEDGVVDHVIVAGLRYYLGHIELSLPILIEVVVIRNGLELIRMQIALALAQCGFPQIPRIGMQGSARRRCTIRLLPPPSASSSLYFASKSHLQHLNSAHAAATPPPPPTPRHHCAACPPQRSLLHACPSSEDSAHHLVARALDSAADCHHAALQADPR